MKCWSPGEQADSAFRPCAYDVSWMGLHLAGPCWGAQAAWEAAAVD